MRYSKQTQVNLCILLLLELGINVFLGMDWLLPSLMKNSKITCNLRKELSKTSNPGPP